MVSTQVAADAFGLAKRLSDLEVWNRFEPEHCIVVLCPGDPLPLLVSVLACDEGLLSFHLFSGSNAKEGFEAFQRELEFGNLGDTDPVRTLGFHVEPFADLPEEQQDWLRQEGESPGDQEWVPNFYCEPPFQISRFPEEQELLLMTEAMAAIAQAAQEDLLVPTTLEQGRLCTVILEQAGANPSPKVTVEMRELQRPSILRFPGAGASLPDLGDVPRVQGTWLAGSRTLSRLSFRGDGRLTRMLMVMDESSRYTLNAALYPSQEFQEAVDILAEAFRRKGGPNEEPQGIPEKIVFESKHLADNLGPVLAKAGILCEHNPDLPALRENFQHFLETVTQRAEEVLGPCLRVVSIGDQIPAPDDLEGWDAVDQALRIRFQHLVDTTSTLMSDRALKRYFHDGDPDYLFEEYHSDGIDSAYATWAVLDYRPTRKSKTCAEKLLKSPKDLTRPMQLLLSNMVRSRPSLYRVERVDSEKHTMRVADLLLGGSAVVHDEVLADEVEIGDCLTGRIYKAGNHRFLLPIGPYFWEEEEAPALAFLERIELKRSPSGVRQEAHKFGWLWAWVDSQVGPEVQLPGFRNTSGEEIVWHKATFEVEDEDRVRQLLLEKDHVSCDSRGNFVWLSPPTGPLPEDTILATITLQQGRMILETNSAPRFQAGRLWLLELPGVRFLEVTTRDALEGPEADDAEEGTYEVSPELAGLLQERLDRYYMDWLDTSLPALNGQTPRQACQTSRGRQTVTNLIRDFESPSGPVQMEVPRRKMLRELGLDPNASQPPLPFGGEAPAPEGPKGVLSFDSDVSTQPPARNSQCPCGSGRKYKNCCGK